MNFDSQQAVYIGPAVVRALGHAGIVVFGQSADLRVAWAHNVPRGWAGGDIIGLTDHEFLPVGAAERLIERKRLVLSSGASDTMEFLDGSGDAGRWYDVWLDADMGDAGEVVGVVTTVVEITERKHREQTLRTLLREVSHRSKNLLAIIQSVAMQTGRHAATIETFLDRFRGRLQSLASSQDLVTSSNWRGAMLGELVEGQVARYRAEGDEGVVFSGDDVHLNPNAALHVGLALHELVVNSMSHGALARPGGRAEVVSSLDRADGGKLVLRWLEDTEASGLPRERRFGSVALERVVPQSLDGTAALSIEGGRLVYTLDIPARNFDRA